MLQRAFDAMMAMRRPMSPRPRRRAAGEWLQRGRRITLLGRSSALCAAASVLLVGVSCGDASAQPKATVQVHVLADGVCQIVGAKVACGEAGSKLREMSVPAGAEIAVVGDANVAYAVVKAAMESVSRAGFRLRTGVVTE